MYTETEYKAVTPQEHGLDLCASLGGSTRDVGAGCGSKSQRARTLVAEAPGNTDWHELPQRLPFWHQELAPPNSLQVPMMEHFRPNNQQGENTAPPIMGQAA